MRNTLKNLIFFTVMILVFAKLANATSYDAINKLEQQYSARVIGTESGANGSTKIKLIGPNNNIIIVTIDSSGNVIDVKQ